MRLRVWPLGVLALALALALALSPAARALCTCVLCDSVSVGAGRTYSVTTSSVCGAGSSAFVSELEAQSTDGSQFTVRAYNPATPSLYFTAASSQGSVTCFNKASGYVGEEGQRTISVDITCKNLVFSCPLQQRITFVCRRDSDAPAPVDGGWSAWSSCSAACTQTRSCTSPAPANGGAQCSGSSTQACSGGSCSPASAGGSGSTPVAPPGNSCQCSCCTGAGCSPSVLGFVANAGCSSDCTSLCSSSFSTCAAAASNGMRASSCVTGSSSTDSGSGSGSGGSSPPSLPPNTIQGRLYEGAGCDATLSNSQALTVPGNSCGQIGSNTYGKLLCNRAEGTATGLLYSDSGCKTLMTSVEARLGQCTNVDGTPYSVFINDCTNAAAGAAAAAAGAMLLAAIGAFVAQRAL